MERKTIGAFIAALRKANGMTQQEVADRLYVSNRAVSRWERDECTPDITLIPAIAELFGVTCDELLKGERILDEQKQEKSEARVEKQLRALVNRSISKFKTLIWISLALAAAGFVLMLGISYGFYRPVIGFAVMMLFEASAAMCAVIAVTKIKEARTDNELIENADTSLISRLNSALGILSFSAFFSVIAVIVLSLPLIIFKSSYYVDSVLKIESYFPIFIVLSLLLALVFLVFKERYIAWITEQPYTKSPRVCMMNRLQLGAVLLASVMLIVSPWFNTEPHETSAVVVAMCTVAVALLLADIAIGITFVLKFKDESRELLPRCIRNILMIPLALMLSNAHMVAFSTNGTGVYTRHDLWDTDIFVLAIGLAAAISLVIKIIDVLWKGKNE